MTQSQFHRRELAGASQVVLRIRWIAGKTQQISKEKGKMAGAFSTHAARGPGLGPETTAAAI